MKNNPAVHSLGHAALVVAYVSLVVWIMNNGEHWFKQEQTILGPIAILLLFVFSAAVAGSLVLGRPVMMYLDGQKKEALNFFGLTLGWLAVAMAILLVLNLK